MLIKDEMENYSSYGFMEFMEIMEIGFMELEC